MASRVRERVDSAQLATFSPTERRLRVREETCSYVRTTASARSFLKGQTRIADLRTKADTAIEGSHTEQCASPMEMSLVGIASPQLLDIRRLLDSIPWSDSVPDPLTNLRIGLPCLVHGPPQTVEDLARVPPPFRRHRLELLDLPSDGSEPVAGLCVPSGAFSEPQEGLGGGEDSSQDTHQPHRNPKWRGNDGLRICKGRKEARPDQG